MGKQKCKYLNEDIASMEAKYKDLDEHCQRKNQKSNFCLKEKLGKQKCKDLNEDIASVKIQI